MATYLLFINYTDQGIRDIKNSPPRIEAYKQSLQYSGVKILNTYMMLGLYDLITVVESDNEEAVANAVLKIRSDGNVRIQFYHVYDESEYYRIISKL